MQDPVTKEMSFVDHLEELRWHVIRAVIAVIILTIAAFFNKEIIFHDILLAPTRGDFWTYQLFCQFGDAFCVDSMEFKMQNRTMAGQFTMHMLSAFVTGLIVAFPYIFWEFWKFIKPGLNPIERKYASGAVVFVSSLFAIGVLFGYYVVTPLSVNFLINYKLDPSIENIIDITSYISFVCLLVVGAGIMFQMPVVIYILTRIGIVGPAFLRKYRKHAVIINVIVAAIVTPTSDMVTLTVVAVPMIFLYEISIFISAAVYKRKEEEAKSYY